MAYNILQFLHVLTMFAAVASALIGEVAFHAIGRSGNVAGIRAISASLGPLLKLTPVLFLIGLVFGLAAAIVGGVNLLAPWLVGSYILFAIAMAVGALLADPWSARLAETAQASAIDAPSPEFVAAVHDRRGMLSTAILMTALVMIVFLMVVKPGA